MNVLKLFGFTILTVVGVLLLMVLNDLINPQKPIEVEVKPHFIIYPNDSDDWAETAHALGVSPDSLTWDEFFAHDSLSAVGDVYEHMENRGQ